MLKSSTYHLCWPMHLTVQSPRLLSQDRDVDRLPAQSLASGDGHHQALECTLHPGSPGLSLPPPRGGGDPRPCGSSACEPWIWLRLGKSMRWSQSLFSAAQSEPRAWEGAKKHFAAPLSPLKIRSRARGGVFCSPLLAEGQFFLKTLRVALLNPRSATPEMARPLGTLWVQQFPSADMVLLAPPRPRRRSTSNHSAVKAFEF